MVACGETSAQSRQESVWPESARSAGTGSKGRFERQDRWSGVEGDRGLPDRSLSPGTLKEQEGHQDNMTQVVRTSVVTPALRELPAWGRGDSWTDGIPSFLSVPSSALCAQ